MWLWIPLVVVLVVDQASKYYATHGLMARPMGRLEVIPGLLDFFLQHNTGGAFSIGHEYPMVITGVSLVVIVGFFIWALRLPAHVHAARAANGLILGGALGNLIDRVRLQYVVDFIHFHRGDWYFATFNVADMGITIGIAWFVLLAIFTKQLDGPMGAAAADSGDPRAGDTADEAEPKAPAADA